MENEIDNSKLEELMRDPEREEELLRELEKSQLILPVIFPEGIFGDFDDMKVGDVISPTEQLGFDINFLSRENGKKSVALFTSDEMMERIGLRSSVMVMYVPDIANMLKGAEDEYKFVTINPFTDVGVDIPVKSFIMLFGEREDDEEESEFIKTLKGILEILEKHSVELEQNMILFLRAESDFMKEQAVDGVFAPNIPLNVSIREDFNKDLPYLNILLMDAGQKILYIGDQVDEDNFDTIIAPGSEFELLEEEDEFTSIWKCRKQPFYE